MKFLKTQDTAAQLVLLGGVGIAVFFLVKRFGAQIGQAVGDAAQAINPINADNVFARGADAVTSTLADTDTSIGSLLFDWVQRLKGQGPFDPNAPNASAFDTPENINNHRVLADPNIVILPGFESAFEQLLRERGIGI